MSEAAVNYPSSDEPLSRFHARELNILRRAVETGHNYAIMEAEAYCAMHKLPQPGWLWRAERMVALNALLGRETVKKGRAGSPLRRLRQDLIHTARYSAVDEVRDKQKEIKRDVGELDALANAPPHYLKRRRHELAQVGSTLRDACEFAPRLLLGSDAHAGADAFEKSYKLVRRAHKNPAQAMRFRFLSLVLLRELGLYGAIHPDPGTKQRPLFDPMI